MRMSEDHVEHNNHDSPPLPSGSPQPPPLPHGNNTKPPMPNKTNQQEKQEQDALREAEEQARIDEEIRLAEEEKQREEQRNRAGEVENDPVLAQLWTTSTNGDNAPAGDATPTPINIPPEQLAQYKALAEQAQQHAAQRRQQAAAKEAGLVMLPQSPSPGMLEQHAAQQTAIVQGPGGTLIQVPAHMVAGMAASPQPGAGLVPISMASSMGGGMPIMMQSGMSMAGMHPAMQGMPVQAGAPMMVSASPHPQVDGRSLAGAYVHIPGHGTVPAAYAAAIAQAQQQQQIQAAQIQAAQIQAAQQQAGIPAGHMSIQGLHQMQQMQQMQQLQAMQGMQGGMQPTLIHAGTGMPVHAHQAAAMQQMQAQAQAQQIQQMQQIQAAQAAQAQAQAQAQAAAGGQPTLVAGHPGMAGMPAGLVAAQPGGGAVPVMVGPGGQTVLLQRIPRPPLM